MTDKALISELSWRSLDVQRRHFPDMPIFIAPHEIPELLRPSQRKDELRIWVAALGVIADNEKDLRAFLFLIKKRGAAVMCKDIEWRIDPKEHDVKEVIARWRKSRREGAAKAGGDAKSKNSEIKFWEGFSKIADRWHLNETSKSLMKEAGIKHHDTMRANLGYTRWEWRKLSDAKRVRILKSAVRA